MESGTSEKALLISQGYRDEALEQQNARKRTRTRFCRILLAEIVASLFIFALVLLAVQSTDVDDWHKKKKHHHHHHHDHKHKKHHKGKHDKKDLCESPQCIIAASSILQRVAPEDTDINPCTNFDDFVCGGWRDTHDMRPDQGAVGESSLMYERAQMLLRHVMEDPYPETSDHSSFSPMSLEDDKNDVDRENFNLIKDAYAACMDEKHIDSRGIGPLADILGHVKDIFSSNNTAQDVITDAWIYANEHGVSPLLIFSIGADDKHPDTMAVTIFNPWTIGLPSKEYYKNEKVVKTYTEAISAYLTNLKLTEDAEKLANDIVAFESKIATYSMDTEDMLDVTKTYNPTPFDEVQKLFPQLNLDTVFKEFSPDYRPEQILVSSADYLKNLSSLLPETNIKTVEGYFQLKIANAYSTYIASDVNKPIRELRNVLQGKEPSASSERWRTCTAEIDGILGWILGRFFIEKAFSEKAKVYGDQIIMDIKKEFAARLGDIDWISKSVRKLARQKVFEIVQKIGYPDKSPDVRSPEALKKYYADVSITNSTFFENAVSTTQSELRKQWKALSKPTNRDEWGMTPPTVNAYYNPPQNEIVFPAGIMQRPLFSVDLPGYINYGAFGAISGHELSHAFDSTGRHYDVYGNYTDWWDEETVKNFEDKAQCFVKQYSEYSVEGPDGKPLHVNGALTLGENIADAGGVNAAYGAWKKRDKEKPDQLLPGLHERFTKDQLFFISYSAFWCSKTRKEAAINRIYTDPHSPPFARIAGTMANSEDFLKAFKCPAKKATCKMW